jgi:rRNA small subunit pseudouridine methyltransferase Nep1
MGIILIIAEAALELVPKSIAWHNAVKKHAKSKGKDATSILLDRSYHHAAMLNLKDAEKRGRPDIVHFTLLEATSIPLYFNNMLDVYIHTIDDKVIEVGKGVRLPKNYNRFVGLIEDLYAKKVIASNEGDTLLSLHESSLSSLIDKIKPSKVIGLSRHGISKDAEYVAKQVIDESKACIVIGGFAKGTFSQSTLSMFNQLISISSYPLEAHVVAARVLYEVEKVLCK